MVLFKSAVILALVLARQEADAACEALKEMMMSSDVTKLSFSGFNPTVTRISTPGIQNKVVLKEYTKEPILTLEGDVLTVTAGTDCDGVPSTPTMEDESSVRSIATLTAAAIPLLAGVGWPAAAAAALAAQIAPAKAQSSLECQLTPIEVMVYVGSESDEIVMREAQSGDFEVCPPEALFWKHHPDVYGGYEGCVGEEGYYPCRIDSTGVSDGSFEDKRPIMWDGESCVDTEYDKETRTYWILWGDPLDKHELNKRTGLNPVVSFPFNRGPYPTYQYGKDIGAPGTIDDSADARAMAKDFLVYLGAFTKSELSAWDVSMTEGAESGMVAMWGAKALEIAQTTCNRDIFALVEVPAYGYSPDDSASLANKHASTFYAGEECSCFANMTCNDPDVAINVVAWVPLTPLPAAPGGDGIVYAADSASAASPWMESMVFPENPTGKIKTPQLPNANRRVCDGVYVWPMYFGMTDFQIPIDERPDCSSWSFSITKAYSASVRAGFIIYKEDPVTNHDAHVSIISGLHSMTNGLYSEWSWYGQMQLWEMMMSKPISDPTSWIGAYSTIMKDKWDKVIDGFKDCPVLELTNPYAGAYAFFEYKAPYLAVQDGFVSSFFRDVLGIRTTTYNFGFRGLSGEDIERFYGPGYTQYDFTRLNLYRDVKIYDEVARRAMLVCGDPDASIGDFISVNQWATAASRTRSRRLSGGYADMEDRKRHLREIVPDLNERQLVKLAESHEHDETIDRRAEECGPDYSMGCLFEKVGTRFNDYN